MKNIFFLFFASFLFACTTNSGKQKVTENFTFIEKPIAFSDTNTELQKTFSELSNFKDYVFPFYLWNNDGKGSPGGTGFFITYYESKYFVTARHTLFDLKSGKLHPATFISIYTNPDNLNEKGLELQYTKYTPTQACFGDRCFDIALIKIDSLLIPKVKYVNIEKYIIPSDTIKNNTVLIPGYPSDTFKLVKTSLEKWNDNLDLFYTKEPSNYQASGSPVFIKSKNGEFICMGIYRGRNKLNNWGEVTKINLLISLLKKLHS